MPELGLGTVAVLRAELPRDAQRAWSRYQSSKNGLATFCHLFDRRSRNTAMMASKMRETFCATFPPTRWKPLHVIRTRENTFSSSPLRNMPLLVLTKRPSAGKIVSNNFGC
jgi:hypothetical protein